MTAPLGTINFQVNRLEGRELPSATINTIGPRLEIVGDAAANTIAVRDDGRGNVSVNVTSGAEVVTGSAIKISEIVIDSKGGADSVDYRLTKNLLFAQDLDIDLGEGSDRARLDLYRGLSGVPLDIELDGGTGADSVEARFGVIGNSQVDFNARLGKGADNLYLILFSGIGGKSHVGIEVAGNTGADRVDMNLMGKIDATAVLAIDANNAADANDRLIVRYKGELDGNLTVTIDRAAAQYGVQAHFTLDAASDGQLMAHVTDNQKTYHSTATVNNHSGPPKITVLDRLGRFLTQPLGITLTKGV